MTARSLLRGRIFTPT